MEASSQHADAAQGEAVRRRLGVSQPFVRALGKLGVGLRIAGDPRGKQVPGEAGEGGDEEVIVAARVPWQEVAQGEARLGR